VVHRDLKPTNVLLAEDGPRVIDFGISWAAEATSPLTEVGIVMGSTGFMSPEQAQGGDVGPPSDIFSLGAVLAFAAMGEGPFGSGPSEALVYRVIHAEPNLARLPDAVRPLVERCLAKDPGQRPSAADILAEVSPVQPGPGWLPEPIVRAVTAGPLPAGAVAGGGTREEKDQTRPSASLGGQTVVPGATPPLPVPVPGPTGGQIRSVGGAPPRRSATRRLVLAGLVGVLAVAAVVAGFALTSTPAKSHVSGNPSPPPRSSAPASPRPTLRGWTFGTPASVDGSPAVADGLVFIGDDNGNIYALDAATGALRWKIDTKSSVVSRPAVVGGTVYVGSENNYVYALNAATGAIRWSRRTGGQVNSSPALSGGTLYVGSDDGKVYALDAATGAVEWTRPTAGKVDSGPAVSGGTVYVGGGDTVYALDAATGAIKWTRATGGVVTSSPAVSDGIVYVGSNDGYVYALDAATGAIRWREQTGGQVNSSPVVSGGRVYIGTDNDAVYAFNAANGRS
jgi:outer membrane protein assembly factor BamB